MNRAGTTITNLDGKLAYKSFRPAPLPPRPALAIDEEMGRLVIETNKHVSALDAVAANVANADLFLAMYVRKEALISSQIEGTQCTLDDVLNPTIDANANRNVGDVVNYVKALNFAIDRMAELPLCNRLLRETHALLLSGVRGDDKEPGEFRHSQNWIGPAGCTLAEARFVPPNPDDMAEAMSALEVYLHDADADSYDPLVRASLIHYQFETVHPFLDGNGRIGRMLVILYLMQEGLLQRPLLYVSYFLKKNQLEYYDRMGEVRRTGNYEQWVRFFLEAVDAAAKDALLSIERLVALRKRDLARTAGVGKTAERLFSILEERPIVDIRGAADALGVSFNTAQSAVLKLVDLGVLRQIGTGKRSRVFAYEDYLAILREGTE